MGELTELGEDIDDLVKQAAERSPGPWTVIWASANFAPGDLEDPVFRWRVVDACGTEVAVTGKTDDDCTNAEAIAALFNARRR